MARQVLPLPDFGPSANPRGGVISERRAGSGAFPVRRGRARVLSGPFRPLARAVR